MKKVSVVNQTCIEREKIVFSSTVHDAVGNAKNNCIHDILGLLEIFFETDSKEWVKVRKNILDNVNNYHRIVLDIIDRTSG